MRFAGPGLFVLIGLVTGVLFARLFPDNSPGTVASCIAGFLGAFFGLFFKDVFDLEIGGLLTGAAIFATLGALAFNTALLIFYRKVVSRT
ncbi:hypothetical protein Q4485_08710 [Granulosicoccaceae sp. 1_MG-2023]|nr:hypothetical protein [Granulosicoccaceae sp. 1_MG-2023]